MHMSHVTETVMNHLAKGMEMVESGAKCVMVVG